MSLQKDESINAFYGLLIKVLFKGLLWKTNFEKSNFQSRPEFIDTMHQNRQASENKCAENSITLFCWNSSESGIQTNIHTSREMSGTLSPHKPQKREGNMPKTASWAQV